MTRLDLDIDRLIAGWRGPLLAAFAALIATLPGLIAMPPLDRTEARFAQATAQILEHDEWLDLRFQDRPVQDSSPAVHWMQAASVALFSEHEARDIWAYRLPSLLGAMLAAAACAWGAAQFWGARVGLLAGLMLGTSFLVSTAGFVATPDALLCGLMAVAMASLARLYAAAREGRRLERRTRLVFWVALALSMLVKGPVGLLIAACALVTLAVWDRRFAWMRRLGWSWGAILVLAAGGPWALAVTVNTDADFWWGAVRDLAQGLGADGRHGAWPGAHAAALPLLFFPATLLLVAAGVVAWRRRGETGVRFAAAWLAPAWIVFELIPGKLPHYVLPLYPALAWLAAASLTENLPRRAIWGGVVLSGLAAASLSVLCVWLLGRYGNASDPIYVTIAVGLLLTGVFVGAWFMLHRKVITALALSCAAGVLAHAAIVAGLAPQLKPLFGARVLERVLDRHGLDPRDGMVPGPVAVAGYGAPSVVFLLGTATELVNAEAAAQAVAEGRPAVVEARQADAFTAALAARGLKARPTAEVRAYDYSDGDPISLMVYRPEPARGAAS